MKKACSPYIFCLFSPSLTHIYLQDILSEIQRLKEEANRFIAILAKEEEDADENLSPARRQTLTREVDSLQVILRSFGFFF